MTRKHARGGGRGEESIPGQQPRASRASSLRSTGWVAEKLLRSTEYWCVSRLSPGPDFGTKPYNRGRQDEQNATRTESSLRNSQTLDVPFLHFSVSGISNLNLAARLEHNFDSEILEESLRISEKQSLGTANFAGVRQEVVVSTTRSLRFLKNAGQCLPPERYRPIRTTYFLKILEYLLGR